MPKQANSPEVGPKGAQPGAIPAQPALSEEISSRTNKIIEGGADRGLSVEEADIVTKAASRGFIPTSGRLILVRHAATASDDATPEVPILEEWVPKTLELGHKLSEAGYLAATIEHGEEQRCLQTATLLTKSLAAKKIVNPLINARNRNASSRAEAEAWTAARSIQAVTEGRLLERLAAGETTILVIHRGNYGLVREIVRDFDKSFNTSTGGMRPLDMREFDIPSILPQGKKERPSIDHDRAGTIHVKADNFKIISDALANQHKPLADAVKRVSSGALSVVDFQNLLNATLILGPEFTKPLAGCGAAELDLMALRAAMGVKPYEGTEFDGKAAAKAFTALAKSGALGGAGCTLEAAQKRGTTGRLAARLARDAMVLGAVREAAKEAKTGGLASFAALLEVATSAHAAFSRSMDDRISGARAENPADWPLGGTYHPTFRILDSDGNEVYDDTASPKADGSMLLKSLIGDHPGVTVVEAEGGSGKSILLAQAVRGWLANGKNALGKAAYMGLAAKQIDEKGEISEVRERAETADIILLDSLDEAKWVDADRTLDLNEKRKKFSAWIENLARQGKRIVLTARPGHWAGGGRRLKIPAFGATRADTFVRDFLAGHARESVLVPGWETLRRAAESDAALAEIVGNPLTLLLLCQVVTDDETHDETKSFSWYAQHIGHLFEDAARMRLEKWENGDKKTRNDEKPAETKEHAERLMGALGQLAYLMSAGWDITEKNIYKLLPDNIRRDAVRLLKKANGEESFDVGPLGLLVQGNSSGKITFAHERMREYFAKRHICSLIKLGAEPPLASITENHNGVTLDTIPNNQADNSLATWRERQELMLLEKLLGSDPNDVTIGLSAILGRNPGTAIRIATLLLNENAPFFPRMSPNADAIRRIQKNAEIELSKTKQKTSSTNGVPFTQPQRPKSFPTRTAKKPLPNELRQAAEKMGISAVMSTAIERGWERKGHLMSRFEKARSKIERLNFPLFETPSFILACAAAGGEPMSAISEAISRGIHGWELTDVLVASCIEREAARRALIIAKEKLDGVLLDEVFVEAAEHVETEWGMESAITHHAPVKPYIIKARKNGHKLIVLKGVEHLLKDRPTEKPQGRDHLLLSVKKEKDLRERGYFGWPGIHLTEACIRSEELFRMRNTDEGGPWRIDSFWEETFAFLFDTEYASQALKIAKGGFDSSQISQREFARILIRAINMQDEVMAMLAEGGIKDEVDLVAALSSLIRTRHAISALNLAVGRLSGEPLARIINIAITHGEVTYSIKTLLHANIDEKNRQRLLRICLNDDPPGTANTIEKILLEKPRSISDSARLDAIAACLGLWLAYRGAAICHLEDLPTEERRQYMRDLLGKFRLKNNELHETILQDLKTFK